MSRSARSPTRTGHTFPRPTQVKRIIRRRVVTAADGFASVRGSSSTRLPELPPRLPSLGGPLLPLPQTQQITLPVPLYVLPSRDLFIRVINYVRLSTSLLSSLSSCVTCALHKSLNLSRPSSHLLLLLISASSLRCHISVNSLWRGPSVQNNPLIPVVLPAFRVRILDPKHIVAVKGDRVRWICQVLGHNHVSRRSLSF